MIKDTLGKNYKFFVEEIETFTNPLNFSITDTKKPLNYKGLWIMLTDALSFEELDTTLQYLTINNKRPFGASFFIINDVYVVLNRELDLKEVVSHRFIDYKTSIRPWIEAYSLGQVTSIKYYVILANGTPVAFDISLDKKPYSMQKIKNEFLDLDKRFLLKDPVANPNWDIINDITLKNKQPQLLDFFNVNVTDKKLRAIRPVRYLAKVYTEDFIYMYNAGDLNYPIETRKNRNDPISSDYLEDYYDDYDFDDEDDYDDDFEDSEGFNGDFLEKLGAKKIVEGGKTTYKFDKPLKFDKDEEVDNKNIEIDSKNNQETFKKFNNESTPKKGFAINPMDYIDKEPEDFINAMLENLVHELYDAARAMGVQDSDMHEYFEEAIGEFSNLNLPNFPKPEEVKARVRIILDKLIAGDSKTIETNKDKSKNKQDKENPEEFGEEIN